MVDPFSTLLNSALESGPWTPAPDELVVQLERALPLPVSCAFPPEDVVSLEWNGSSDDIRSLSIDSETKTATITEVQEFGELGLVATGSKRDRCWRVRGMLWLVEPAGSVQFEWIQADHVILSAGIESGRPFEFEEIVGPSWRLEFHLPSGKVVEVADPS